MIASHRLNFFSLSESGVRCDENGLFVGPLALLHRDPQPNGRETWSPRPSGELDRELGDLYGWPINSWAKRDGLTCVARALDRLDVTFAKVSALLCVYPPRHRSLRQLLPVARLKSPRNCSTAVF